MLSTALGKITSFSTTTHGIEGTTENANFRITVYSSTVIRVHIAKNDYDEHSYSVVGTPGQDEWELKETDSTLIISTSAASCEIDRATTSITFKDSEGAVLNQDEAGLGVSWIGDQVTNYKKMQPGERFIGLGEKTGPLDRRGHGYQHWNTDEFAYGPATDPIYSSMPFYIGLHEGKSYGLFFDNTHKTHINFGASNNRFSSISADLGDLNYYLFAGSVREIIEGYTWLTGRMSMPPLWGLGYQQCRYSYYPDDEVHMVANTFREKNIPADAIVLDIHYMDEYKIYTWDKERFPDPQGMMDTLREKGFNIVVMCDPGIKEEKGYETYESGIEEDIFIKYPDGTNYTGEVWPGWCHFPDFTNPKAREWWKKQLPAYTKMGVEGFWNDMNEIATWGHKLPDNIEFNFEGNPATARKGRNIYGFQMSRSTFEATKELMNKRPFNLTRSGFSGIQRYAAVWTGDNVANDEHMLLGVRLVNSLGLTGVAFSGYDVGGFAGNASEHLFARWIQLGAFSPFFRGHSMVNSRDSEPWAFGEEVEAVSRNYITLRYRLMMYIYSAFYEAAQTGIPVNRSLAIDYAHQPEVYDGLYENQFLFGNNFLVAPVRSDQDIVKVYLPEGHDWYDFLTDTKFEGGRMHYIDTPINRLPVFVKEGSVLPISETVGAHTGELGDTLEWHVYKGKASEFAYYEDDGSSYNYEDGENYQRMIRWDGEGTLTFHQARAHFDTRFQKYKVVLHGFDASGVTLNGTSMELSTEDIRLVEPVPSFDPLNKELDYSLTVPAVQICAFDNSSDEMVIKVN